MARVAIWYVSCLRLISLSWNEKHTHTKTGTLSWYESDAKDAKMIGSVKLDGYVPKVIDEITFKLMHASETRVDVMCKVAERTDRDRWIEAIKLASIPMKNLKVERMSSKQAKKEAEKFYVLDERVEAWRRLDNETRDLMYGMLDIDPRLRLGVRNLRARSARISVKSLFHVSIT